LPVLDYIIFITAKHY